MQIKVTSFVWALYSILTILMGGSIGRSYMWLVTSIIILFFWEYKKGMRFPRNQLVKGYVIFVTYCTIITFISVIVSGFARNEYIKTQLLELLILGFTASYLAAGNTNIEEIIRMVKGASWLLLIGGVVEEVTKVNWSSYMRNQEYVSQYLMKDGRIISVFSHPIGYAMFLVFCFLLALYFPYQSKNRQITYLFLLLVNLLCTKTRMAMLSIFLVLVLYELKNRNLKNVLRGKIHYSKNVIIYSAILLTVGIFIMITFKDQMNAFLDSIVNRIGQIFTRSEQGVRLGVIAGFFTDLRDKSILEILFGRGTGYASQYMMEYPIYYWNAAGEKIAWNETTDNMYISILMNYGLIGFLFFLNILIKVILMMWKRQSRLESMACCGIISLYFNLFFFEGLFWPVVMNIFGIYMAFLSRANDESRRKNRM